MLRLFMLNAHYRSPLNFRAELMDSSKNALERIRNAAANLKYTEEHAQAETMSEAEQQLAAGISEYRKKFFEVIRSSVSGGSNRGTCLHYIFIVCIITASCQSRCSSSHYGVELYWRVDFQYACTGRCGEDVRQGSEGNDGIIKNRVCMVRNRTYPVVCYEPILQCLCCHYISYFPENRNEQNLMESLFVWHEKSGRTYRLS